MEENLEKDFEVSFIFSYDELYTLIILFGEPTENGKIFMEKAIPGAAETNLLSLADKKMAYIKDGKLLIEPVIRMISAAICKADKLEVIESDNNIIYVISSPWIEIRCVNYSKAGNFMKLTPLKPKVL